MRRCPGAMAADLTLSPPRRIAGDGCRRPPSEPVCGSLGGAAPSRLGACRMPDPVRVVAILRERPHLAPAAPRPVRLRRPGACGLRPALRGFFLRLYLAVRGLLRLRGP